MQSGKITSSPGSILSSKAAISRACVHDAVSSTCRTPRASCSTVWHFFVNGPSPEICPARHGLEHVVDFLLPTGSGDRNRRAHMDQRLPDRMRGSALRHLDGVVVVVEQVQHMRVQVRGMKSRALPHDAH